MAKSNLQAADPFADLFGSSNRPPIASQSSTSNSSSNRHDPFSDLLATLDKVSIKPPSQLSTAAGSQAASRAVASQSQAAVSNSSSAAIGPASSSASNSSSVSSTSASNSSSSREPVSAPTRHRLTRAERAALDEAQQAAAAEAASAESLYSFGSRGKRRDRHQRSTSHDLDAVSLTNRSPAVPTSSSNAQTSNNISSSASNPKPNGVSALPQNSITRPDFSFMDEEDRDDMWTLSTSPEVPEGQLGLMRCLSCAALLHHVRSRQESASAKI